MSTQTTISRPAKFVEDIGTDLAKQAVGMTGVPVVSTGIAGLKQAKGETAAGFKARQDAARAFEVRQQNLAGLAPKVAGQDALQQQAQRLAQSGVGSFQPFLTAAQQQAGAAGTTLGGAAGQFRTAGSTLGGVSLGAPTAAQTQAFMSPYQSQVMEASLAEFDRNKAIQEQGLRDQAVASGAFGGGREGVAMAEYDKASDMNRAQLQASLLNQGFQQAMGARQQDIANRFGLGQAQMGLGGAQQGLAGAQQGLGGFQAGLGAQLQGMQGTDISRLGSLGALNQAQTQAGLDATRQANQMAAYQPQEQLQNYANIVTGIMGGMAGSGSQQTQVPNPSPLQTALGAAATGAGIYGALK
jgi:hypothetical protein